MADFLRLIDGNAGGWGLKKGQGILHLILRTGNSIDKEKRAKPARTENGSCELNSRDLNQTFLSENSRRLWRSQRRKSSSVPAGAANFPAAVFLAGKCPNLGRDSISHCRKFGGSFSSSVEICRKTAGNFGQPQPSRVF